jgi:hypothetical protein
VVETLAQESIHCFVSVCTTLVKASKACLPRPFFEHCNTLRAITIFELFDFRPQGSSLAINSATWRYS